MRYLVLVFVFVSALFAPTTTFYGDWGWGYYFWLFGPIGPITTNGMAAAGYESGIEYRGFSQFSLSGWPGQGTEITSLVLRLRNNTGGSGLQIDINRVVSTTPSWDECGGTSPIYLTNQAVTSAAEDYTYFDLSGTAATGDLLSAWEAGTGWFGLGYKGSRGSGEPCMHYFYSFFADPMYDAALLVNYTIGIEEAVESTPIADLRTYPNPAYGYAVIALHQVGGKGTVSIYSSCGRRVRQFVLDKTADQFTVVWDGSDQKGDPVAEGVYFVKWKGVGFEKISKIVLLR
jgi:hypothetical protein